MEGQAVMKPISFFNISPLYLLTLMSTLSVVFVPVEAATSASIFTDPSSFNNSTLIDFEPTGSGNTVSGINNWLNNLGTGATLSLGGGSAQIADLSNSVRASSFGVNGGADGGAVSGSWGFEGGVFEESSLTLTFAPGNFQQAVGAYWGGVVNTAARAFVTFSDNSNFIAYMYPSLPLVSNSASNAQGINGFLGINGDGKLIKSVTFLNGSDLYSQDNVKFGSVGVPEPLTIFGAVTALGFGAFFKNKTKRRPTRNP
jgi:hypothetical protein